jgi:hypothetical protein
MQEGKTDRGAAHVERVSLDAEAGGGSPVEDAPQPLPHIVLIDLHRCRRARFCWGLRGIAEISYQYRRLAQNQQ